jgi:hypothetical protein
MQVQAASDGYLVTSSNYDGKVYVLGKGPSATTVSVPQVGIADNTPVMISGTVLDQSPNQPGTPCISDASMSTWMDYLNMQMPIGGIYNNITIYGVPVTLYAVNPNGALVTLGTVNSTEAGTYSFEWTPTIAGVWSISAVFAGSNSYGSSSAATSAVVMAASTTSATPTPTPTASPTASPITNYVTSGDLATYIAIAIIVIVIAIAVVGALLLRRKP